VRSVTNQVKRMPHAEFFLLFIVALMDIGQAQAKPPEHKDCTVDVISKVKSPDGNWLASVNEYECSDGWFVTDFWDYVQLVRLRDGIQEEVCSVEYYGDPTSRPVPRWVSTKALDINVPNKSIIGFQKKQFGGVSIHLKFHPNNPKERERWLKEINRTPQAKGPASLKKQNK
jgi:hypothetical protein